MELESEVEPSVEGGMVGRRELWPRPWGPHGLDGPHGPGGGGKEVIEGSWVMASLGGPVHSFPPIFFSGAPLFPLFFVLAGIGNTQKQTDAEQREALFSTR